MNDELENPVRNVNLSVIFVPSMFLLLQDEPDGWLETHYKPTNSTKSELNLPKSVKFRGKTP